MSDDGAERTDAVEGKSGVERTDAVEEPDVAERTDDTEESDAGEKTDATGTVRAYYEAIDAGDYDAFADLLAPGVVHERPDRTIEGRETLVGFMREGRPNKDTSHEIRCVFGGVKGDTDVAVEGRLLDAEGEEMFEFVDSFSLSDERIVEIRTYAR
jgi:ketosteroid isomerase-like protein